MTTTTQPHTETVEIRNRWTKAVIFTATITCQPGDSDSVKLGLAVQMAVAARPNLARAYLADAYLARVNLADAKNLNDEYLRPFKADLFLTLDSLHAGPLEAQHLIAKLRAGEVDGSTYGHGDTNECSCLVGTIAQVGARNIELLDRNGDRPAERWFMMIRPGDKPGSVDADGKPTGGGYAAQKALEWVLDWCACHGVDPDPVEAKAA